MPALNFKKRFADMVENGHKRQTIRAKRKDGKDPKPGDTLYLYTGMRTKACRRLKQVECEFINTIRIENDNRATLDGSRIGMGTCLILARQDGFDSLEEFFTFFETEHGLPFEGLLIRW